MECHMCYSKRNVYTPKIEFIHLFHYWFNKMEKSGHTKASVVDIQHLGLSVEFFSGYVRETKSVA
jgi:hypothetical protein